jgi:hypothetical protein
MSITALPKAPAGVATSFEIVEDYHASYMSIHCGRAKC